MAKLKVFLADDHPVLRNGLRLLVNAQPDMEVVGESGNGEAIVANVTTSGADVVVIDVAMPKVGGARATELLRCERPGVKVLALSAYEERGYIEQMLAAGASGYVVKRTAAEDLIHAIRRVAKGDTYLDPAVAGLLVAGLVQGRKLATATVAKLSERETEVLRLIARGGALKEIASTLSVGVRTVETYKARAMEKAGLRSRADVVRFAAERGWLGVD